MPCFAGTVLELQRILGHPTSVRANCHRCHSITTIMHTVMRWQGRSEP